MKRFYYKKSRINQLKGFCYTVQQGSVRGAAAKVGVEPGTITMQIRSLEGDLGIKLFERTKNHRLILTEKGKKFYDKAIIQVQGIDGLFESFYAGLKEERENKLIIASHYTSLSFVLPKYVKKLTEKFPNLEIKLCNISKQEAIERLRNEKIDFAFYPAMKNEIIPIEIEKERIFNFGTAIFIHKNHPLAKKEKIAKKDLEKHEYLLIDKYTFYDPSKIVNFRKSKVIFEKGNSYITLGLVKENVGIGGGSEIFLTTNTYIDKEIVFKNVDHLFPKMFFSLFALKNKIHKQSMLFFFDELRKDSDVE